MAYAIMFHFSSYILTVCLILLCRTHSSYSSFHASNQTQITVKDFLPNIAGCVVHVIMNPNSSSSEAALVQFVGHFEESGGLLVTLLISECKLEFLDNSTRASINRVIQPDLHWEKWDIGLERDLDKTPYTHLYFISKEEDLQRAIHNSFLDFGLRKILPQFVVFWSVAMQSSINWRKQFQNPIFYNAFTDYRILVGRESQTEQYSVSLICIICSLHGHWPDSHLIRMYKADTLSMKQLWIVTHRNHHGLKINVGQGELLEVRLHNGDRGFVTALKGTLNVSVALDSYIFGDETSLASIEFKNTGIGIPGKGATSFPMFRVQSACVKMEETMMLSIVRKTGYIEKTWIRVFYPFLLDTWCTLLILLIAIGIFLAKTESRKNLRKSEIFLKVVAPLLDKSYGTSAAPVLTTLLNCWAIFCVSVTVLHGGELFSSLAAVAPPVTPESLAELCDSNDEIHSQSSGSYMAYYYPAIYNILPIESEDFRKSIDIDRSKKCIHEIHNKVNRQFCQPPNRILIPTSRDKPQICKDLVSNPSYRRPVTFIEMSEEAQRLQKIYARSPNIWWTKRRSLKLRPIWRPFVTSVNYFNNLFVPLLSGWSSGGLRDNIETLRVYLQDASYRDINTTELDDSERFTPMKLEVLVSVRYIFLVLFALAGVAFTLEAEKIIIRTWKYCRITCKYQFERIRQALSSIRLDSVYCICLKRRLNKRR